MKSRRDYDIAFVGLRPGLHEFVYEINDRFFEEFGQQDFSKTEAKVKLTLEKHSSFLMLKFEVDGNLRVNCDRCGNDLPLNLWDEFSIMVKLTEDAERMNEEEADPDVYYIPRTESHINVKDWIYEFINLSLPMTKTCDKPGEREWCNKEVLAKLSEMNTGKQPANPIKGLDKFKNK